MAETRWSTAASIPGRFLIADGAGDDVITDFTAGAGIGDVVDLSDHSTLDRFGDALTSIGVAAAGLHQNDFAF